MYLFQNCVLQTCYPEAFILFRYCQANQTEQGDVLVRDRSDRNYDHKYNRLLKMDVLQLQIYKGNLNKNESNYILELMRRKRKKSGGDQDRNKKIFHKNHEKQ